MLKLLLMFIVAVLAYSSPFIEDSSGPYWSPSTWESPSKNQFHEKDWSYLVHHRVKRGNGPDNLKAQLERLQRVARIVNGISIRLGLIAKTVTSEDLIAELLFFGPIKLSEIMGMDSTPIEKSIEELKNLPVELKPNDSKAAEAEKVLAEMGKVLNAIDGMGDKDWDKQLFTAEVNGLSNGDITLSEAEAFIALKGELIQFGRLAGTKTLDTDFIKAYSSNVFLLLKELSKLAKNLRSGPIHGFQIVKTASDTIRTLFKAAKGVSIVNIQKKAIELTADQKSAYSTFLGKLPKPSKDVQTKLAIVKDLMKRQLAKSRGRDLKVTFGMPNGVTDISTMFYDFQDPLIESIVDVKSLEIALKDLEQLKLPLGQVEQDLAFKEADVKLLESIIAVFYQMDSIDASKITEGMNEAETNPIPWSDIEPKVVEDVVKVGELLESVDNKLARINSLTQEIRDILKPNGLIKWADDVIKICEGAASAPDPQQTLKTFREYSHLKELSAGIVKVFDKLQEIEDVQKVKKINDEANAALKFDQQLENFHKHVKANYATSFKNLLTTKSLKTAAEIVEIIQKIRSFKADTDNAKAIVQKVIGTKNDLTKAIQMIEPLKTDNNGPEFLKLMRNDVSKQSEVIGNSIRGVSNMHNALSQKSQVEDFLTKIQAIKKNQNLLADAGDVKNLKDLVALESPLHQMLASLKAFNGAVPAIDSSKLEDYSVIFAQAQSVTGANANFLDISDTVGRLKDKVQDPGDQKTLDETSSALRTLDAMGLDFAFYKTNFPQTKTALKAVDDLFMKFTSGMKSMPTTLATLASQTAPPLVSSTQAQLVAESSTIQEPKGFDISDPPLWFIILIGVILLVLFVCCIVNGIMYCVCRPKLKAFWKFFACCKKEKKHKRGSSESSSDSETEDEEKAVGKRNRKKDGKKKKKGKKGGKKKDGKRKKKGKKEKVKVKEGAKNKSEKSGKGQKKEVAKPKEEKKVPAGPAAAKVSRRTVFERSVERLFELIWPCVEEELLEKSYTDRKKVTLPEAIAKHAAFDDMFHADCANTVVYTGRDRPFADDLPTEYRYPIQILNDKRVKLKDYGKRFNNDYYPASYYTLPRGKKTVIIGQTPQLAAPGKNLTIPKFWWLAKQSRTKHIVMLGPLTEGVCFDVDGTEIEPPSQDAYFPMDKGQVMTFGDLTLTCLEATEDIVDHIWTRKISVKFGNGKPFEVNHHWLHRWTHFGHNDQMVIENLAKIMDLFKAESSDRMPIVHCVTGGLRTLQFTFSIHLYQNQLLCEGNSFDMRKCMQESREQRPKAVENSFSYACSAKSCLDCLGGGKMRLPKTGTIAEKYHAIDTIVCEHRNNERRIVQEAGRHKDDTMHRRLERAAMIAERDLIIQVAKKEARIEGERQTREWMERERKRKEGKNEPWKPGTPIAHLPPEEEDADALGEGGDDAKKSVDEGESASTAPAKEPVEMDTNDPGVNALPDEKKVEDTNDPGVNALPDEKKVEDTNDPGVNALP